MVAIVVSFLFVASLAVAVGVIVASIAPEIARIRGLIDGSLREVVAPSPIALTAPRRRHMARPRLSPAAVAARAAA